MEESQVQNVQAFQSPRSVQHAALFFAWFEPLKQLNNLNNYFRFSLLNNSRNNFSAGSGSKKPLTRYFLASSRLAGDGTLSLGMSVLIESEGSITFVFMTACQTVCPLRERNQLANTRAALGWGALLINASPLLPLVLIS